MKNLFSRRSKAGRSGTRAAFTGGAGPGASQLEIQIHPADISRRVRYLFLTRKQVAGWGSALVLYLAFLVMGAVFAPRVIGGLLGVREYRALEGEREHQGMRLKALNEQLVELEGSSKDLRDQLRRVLWVYGLSDEESIGQGGYPPVERAVPRSIYAGDIQRGNRLTSDIGSRLQVLEVFVSEIESLETAQARQVRETPSIKPLPDDSFVLTSPFGERISPFTEAREGHAGIDLAALPGTPIHATGDGVVVFAGRFPQRQSAAWWRYGELVVIRHGESFISLYGHCREVLVRQGQRVERGDVIATVGNTGWSSGPHLHYEVRRRDGEGGFRPIDPRVYILDHRWDQQEQLLVRGRSAPSLADYEPLPRLLRR